MKTLLLIPSFVKPAPAGTDAGDRHPTTDYHALAEALRALPGGEVTVRDYGAADRESGLAMRLVRKIGGRDAVLALSAFRDRRAYDAVFTNGENLGIPLALLLSLAGRRSGHVTIGHRLSAGKKRLFFRLLRVHRQMDTIFVYAQTQRDHAEDVLAIPPERLSLIPFHADDHFWRTRPEDSEGDQLCAAGLEWRDYPTLIEAVADFPDLPVRLAAASPWSRHDNETRDRVLPPNVEARRYEYGELRALYARSSIEAVPLRENDFQAGVTTLLEAMAMGKAVIVTRTSGQGADVVVDGETGLTVAPGDVEGWRDAITRLRTDPDLRAYLGRNARRWVERHATLEFWVRHMVTALQDAAQSSAEATAPRLPHSVL